MNKIDLINETSAVKRLIALQIHIYYVGKKIIILDAINRIYSFDSTK